MAVFANGCAAQVKPPAQAGGVARVLRLDLKNGIARSPEWTVRTSDCSNSAFSCLLVPGHMVLAFPRSCSRNTADLPAPSEVGTLAMVAPSAHLAPPAGSYVASSFPEVLLRFDRQRGVFEARRLKKGPSDPEFDPNEYSERFDIQLEGGGALFACP